MKFIFSLETVLRDREIKKNEAEKEYREALNKADKQRLQINKMRNDLANARRETQRVRQGGGHLAAALVSIEEFIVGQKIRTARQSEILKGLEDIAEQKRLVLVEVHKDFKALEKLKEKKYEEFKKEKAKKELKFLDEVSVMRAARSHLNEDGI